VRPCASWVWRSRLGGVGAGGLIGRMGRDQHIIDELKWFERLCLELADESTMPAGLIEMAINCRAEILDRERANRFAHMVPTRGFFRWRFRSSY